MSHKNSIYSSFPLNFNKRETLNNDINRISSIHKPLNQRVTMIKSPSKFNMFSLQNNFKKPNTNVYNFSPTTNNNINLSIQREDENHKIPKIILKEIPIPQYSNNDKFDLNKISETIHQNIQMTIVGPTIIYDGIDDINVSSLKQKNVQKIYHVYQEKYLDNIFATGFGDFIRSCFFIIQFSSKYNFQYEIIINHPIAFFLNKFLNPVSKTKPHIYNNIHMFTETNWHKNIYDKNNYILNFQLKTEKSSQYSLYLNQLPVIDNSIFSYNILFPINIISEEERNIVRSLFEPTDEIKEYLQETLNLLQITSNNFIVIHIRSGDLYLNGKNTKFNIVYFNAIKNEISNLIFNNNVLLIADNNEIKYLLKNEFPSLKFNLNEITHLGEGVELEREKVKNTLLDFYIMSHSSYIHSLTSYPHGSGFSYWCSVIYNIPYKCKFINIKY
jgi:hypothetical protein